ncbi:MAG: enoyl-CoA hydratase/isomerase family protein [Planctomycetes bacterium]|nr:enoyl-CoA hydratase/isomerase family protein [Planctomycetota bacterium]
MSSTLVRYEILNSTAIIRFNRPEKRNALSRALIADLTAAFKRVAADPKARCVILTGEGPAFCAGMDLDELRGTIGAANDVVWEDAQKLAELFELIHALPKPTIAAVNGHAVAGGAGFVTVCDLAVAVPTARFGYPEVRRGLVAAMVLPHLLRHVGERLARYLLLTGELIHADEAARHGLINQVVQPEMLMETALIWARECAEGGPLALASTKELLRRCSRQALTLEEFARASAEPRLGDECREGLAAFFEKRPAPWINETPR